MEDETKTPLDGTQTIPGENVQTTPTAAQLAFDAGDYAGARKRLTSAPMGEESPLLRGALRWDPVLIATPAILFCAWLAIVFSV